MPPKRNKNKKGKKADDATPVNDEQNQDTFKGAAEEEKTEENPTTTDTTQVETTEATEPASARETTEPEESDQQIETSTHEATTEHIVQEEPEVPAQHEVQHQEPVEEAKGHTEETLQHVEEGLKPDDKGITEINERESLQEKIQEESAQHGVTAEEQQIAGTVHTETEPAHHERTVEEKYEVQHEPEHGHGHQAHEEPHAVIIEGGDSHTTTHVVHEEPVKEHTEHKEPEVTTHQVHAAPVSQPLVEEEKPVEVHHEAHHEVPTDVQEVHKVEELVQHGAVEPEKENPYDSKAPEHSEPLATSIQSNWEKVDEHHQTHIVHAPHAPVQHEDLTESHVTVENPQAHVVVESEGTGIAAHAGSLQESWNVVGEKSSEEPKAREEEEALSDRAVDNALNTRLMDDYPAEGSGNTLKEIAPSPAVIEAASHIPEHASVDYNDRLRRAEEHIKSARALEQQAKYGEAVNLLQSAKETLNPDHFQRAEQGVLEEVNKQILVCTLHIARCYDQLSDFNQSVKYARVILKTAPGNIQAIYLLGIGLVRRGDLEEARVVLKEAKEVKGATEEEARYLRLINRELEKLDQIAESKSKVHRTSPYEEDAQPLLVVNKEGSVVEKQAGEQGTGEKKENKDNKGNGGSGSTEYFLGSLVSSSVLSFVVAKYLLKFPTNRGIVTSLVVGAIAGGVSLLAQRHTRQNK